jgi:hypothetical protein
MQGRTTMDLAVTRNELYVLIKEAVRDVLKEEEFSFLLKNVPVVSKEEMKEIEKTFGKPSRKREPAFRETIDI